MQSVRERVLALKKQKNAVILAHYYVPDEVQAVADFVGDSFYLAKAARDAAADVILFAGVHFMGESAKILNPARRVLLPDPAADCPMAHMASAEQISRLRKEVSDLAVACYINSTAKLKALSDVCVTSSNAVNIVRALPEKTILFIPDENLGAFVAAAVPEKKFYFSGGHCPVHAFFPAERVARLRQAYPGAPVLSHPECGAAVLALSDFVGSTAEIIAFAERSEGKSFIVCTESGVLFQLRRRCPGKTFIDAGMVCADMKKITLEKVLRTLEEGSGEVILDEEEAKGAYRPLARMLALG